MTTKRLTESATALAHALGHKDVGSTDPDAIAEFKASASPEQLEKFKNGFREVDATNWGAKILRELRGEMLAGRKPDITSMTAAAAEHFGVTSTTEIRAALETEQTAFAAEIKANAAAVKAKTKRYNPGEILNPAMLAGKSIERVHAIVSAHSAIPMDEFIAADAYDQVAALAR